MTLKITAEAADIGTRIRVEGRLEGEGVADLDSTCAQAASPLSLDLGALLSIDEIGLGLVRALIASGAVIDGASPYIRLLIGNARLDPAANGSPYRP